MKQPVPTVRRSGSFGAFDVPATALASPYVEGHVAWGTGARLRFGSLPCAYQVAIDEQPQRQPVAWYGVQNHFCNARVAAGAAPSTVFLAVGVILSGIGPETLAYVPAVLGPFVVPANQAVEILLPAWASNQLRATSITGTLEIWTSKQIRVSGQWALLASDPVQPNLHAEFLQFVEPITSSTRVSA